MHNSAVKASDLKSSCPPALFIITCRFRKIVYQTEATVLS